MAEVAEEATHVWSHKARIVMFLAAMRHFRQRLQHSSVTVHYRELDDKENRGSLIAELEDAVMKLQPQRLIVVEPGEWRVRERLNLIAKELGINLEVRPDRHFLCTREDFTAHTTGRSQLRMEFFYREMRRKHHVLMQGEQPVGGAWNFDAENRKNFGKHGPSESYMPPITFPPDTLTREVMKLVARQFGGHPGNLRHFDWPLTPGQAHQALVDFVVNRLPQFGRFQDAMWAAPKQKVFRRADRRGSSVELLRHNAFLYHSRLSAALNLKLLDPREVITAAEAAYQEGCATLASVEGFIRQILGWREYVRGIYWYFMPGYINLNSLEAIAPLPDFYWTGQTDMNCLREVIRQTLELGYAHHIQRLMVTGLFALLLGVEPQALHKWYLAVYVDAVEWVELPNTLGMSQFADGGLMASKPYVATGKYLQRMSNYCASCRYDPAEATGESACPFTTLYWDFLRRHQAILLRNQRMVMQLRNLARRDAGQLNQIQARAGEIRRRFYSSS